MKMTHFVGIDVSKDSFTYCVLENDFLLDQNELRNNQEGVLEFIQYFRRGLQVDFERIIFCMEHTGIYSWIILQNLHAVGATISVENATRIKMSLGLTRGKSDQLDARRIAEFAYRFTDKLSIWRPKSMAIQQLQSLTALRDRLIKVRTQLEVPIKEAANFMEEDTLELMTKPTEAVLKTIESEIQQVEARINQIIDDNLRLKKMVKQITSVPGVGIVTATELIIRTNEFKDFNNAKKLACHVGIAPFEFTSGSSIRGRTKVSPKAHKKLKSLLHMCSMSAISFNNEFQVYYQHKVSLGKNKMSVINAIRNKIIHRIFAIIQNDTMYDKNYQYAFA